MTLILSLGQSATRGAERSLGIAAHLMDAAP